MLLYRVFPYNPVAEPAEPGHATYLHKPQGAGRWDNPDLYGAWYLAMTPEGAIGESFGNLAVWSDAMFEHPSTGLRRALATFTTPDDLSLFDFDDATMLLEIGMRPSQVVIRNKAYTQSKAAFLFNEVHTDGTRKWAGLRWWSYHRPTWTNIMLWTTPHIPAPITLAGIEELTLHSPAVTEAGRALSRPTP